MIASIRGTLLEKSASACLVEAGGLGYEVMLSAGTAAQLPELGAEVRLLTSFQVREDSQQLFGFIAPSEKEAFTLLQTVKGVGPRLALAVLSGLQPAELRDAVQKKRVERLVALPGVGKKLAERIVLELSDKVAGLEPEAKASNRSLAQVLDVVAQAQEALQSLGFPLAVAQRAVQRASDELGPKVGVEALIKLALKSL